VRRVGVNACVIAFERVRVCACMCVSCAVELVCACARTRVALVVQHAKRMRQYFVISGLRRHHIPRHYLTNGKIKKTYGT
jgi:hypothetical protein